MAQIDGRFEGLRNSTTRAVWLSGDFDATVRPLQENQESSLYKFAIAGHIREYSVGGGKTVVAPAYPGAGAAVLLVLVILFYLRDLVASALHAVAAPFYTKLKKDKLLDVEARDALYKVIQHAPGINFLALHKQVKNLNGTGPIAFGALAYHLSQMERFNLIVSKREGRFRRYFDVSANIGADTARIALLQTRPVPAIARAILEAPGQSQAALQARIGGMLGITRQALAYHLRRLEAKDLVRRQEEGRFHRYLPTERLQRLAPFVQGKEQDTAAA